MRWILVSTALLALYIGYCCIDRFDPDVVSGQRVLVTGASMGIGEQIAYHYARHGAHVLVTARSQDLLQNVVAKCKELGPDGNKYHYIVADMSDMQATQYLIQDAVELLGGLDVLVLNHVLGYDLNLWTGSPENLTLFDKAIDINFKSYVHLASYALPHLEDTNGSIAVVSSIAGRIPVPRMSTYSTMKFALSGFFGILRQELMIRQEDVSVTICSLGLIGTDNAKAVLQRAGLGFILDAAAPPSPEDAALAIVKATSQRLRHIYFPLSAWLFSGPRDWWPELIEGAWRAAEPP